MLPIWRTLLPTMMLGLFLVGSGERVSAQTSAGVLQEAVGLIRSNLAGAAGADLEQTALKALVEALSPRVQLSETERTNAPEQAISLTMLYDESIGYVRVSTIEKGFETAFRAACDRLGATNKLQGLVVDLRFARGQGYAEVGGAASLFLRQERPLIDWGEGMVNSRVNANAYTVPVAMLVNGKTAGAAEALAAVFRASGVGLVVGAPSLGQAAIYQEFKLSNGERLRIARKPLKLGDGADLPMTGLKPDIQVPVNPETERLFYADAFANPVLTEAGVTNAGALTSTNRARRFRVSEADLVRERREGFDPENRAAEVAEKPLVRDPALARALDVLKGLAVVRHTKPDFRN